MGIPDEIERTISDFPGHQTLLERAIDWFEGDRRIAGLVLGGSFAHPDVDPDYYSDVDLYVVVRERYFDEVFDDRDAVAEHIGTPLFQFVADHIPGGEHDYIVLYDYPEDGPAEGSTSGPVKVDFMYLSVSDFEPKRKWASFHTLVDNTGEVTDVIAASATDVSDSVLEPSPDRIQNLNQKFWTWCWYVFGKIERGELWEAVDGIHTIRTRALLPLLAWTMQTPEQGYRRLETRLGPDIAPRLEATIAQRDPEALSGALQTEIELYCELRETMVETYDIEVDSGPEIRLRQAIESHDRSR